MCPEVDSAIENEYHGISVGVKVQSKSEKYQFRDKLYKINGNEINC